MTELQKHGYGLVELKNSMLNLPGVREVYIERNGLEINSDDSIFWGDIIVIELAASHLDLDSRYRIFEYFDIEKNRLGLTYVYLKIYDYQVTLDLPL